MKQLTVLLTMLALLAALLTACTSVPAQQPETPNTDSVEDTVPTDPDASTDEEAPQEDIAILDEMEVTLYLPDDQAEGFVETVETVKATPQGIVDALISHGALPEDTVVNDFRMTDNGTEIIEGDTASYTVGDTLHIDLDVSEEFSEAIASTGTAGETMYMGSLVNTMLKAYNADTISVTCNGAAIETGHNVYDQPMTFFETEPSEAS